jgi:hypothetical protein
MKKIKSTEELVLNVLTRNFRARTDDFILYGGILKEMGIDLRKTNLYDFLANAKKNGMPSFETATRCRRHIQEIMPELKDEKTDLERSKKVKDYKEYNLTDIGGNNE